jgi:mono/diheme cytochrome c family protein
MLIPGAGRTVDLPKDPKAGEPPEYRVVCPETAAAAEACEVDKPTYIGWRSFQLHCFQCHGPGGIGTTFGPGLIDLMNQHVDYPRYRYVVKHGFTGRTGAMPTFEKNRAVLKDSDNIYRYLRARADGVLPVGRPKRLKTKN